MLRYRTHMPYIPLMDVTVFPIVAPFSKTAVRRSPVVMHIRSMLGNHTWKQDFVDMSSWERGFSEIGRRRFQRVIEIQRDRFGESIVFVVSSCYGYKDKVSLYDKMRERYIPQITIDGWCRRRFTLASTSAVTRSRNSS